MAEQRVWHIYGTLHNADGTVFNRGRILAYHLFPQAGWNYIAESNIDQGTGAFELIFTTSNFQEAGSSEIEYPTLQIRVTDYNYNPFWISPIYTAPDVEMQLGDLTVQEAINKYWNVCGNVYYTNGEVFFPGYVKVSDVSWTPERELGTCQLNASGYYSVNFTKEDFQQWDVSKISPKLLVRVYSPDGVNVATVNGPEVASAYEYINIYVESGERVNPDDSCKVYGNVFNKLGRPIQDIDITAICLNYKITNQNDKDKGVFEHIDLGVAKTDSNGEYSISYKADKLPTGFLLDAEEPYGKDKVSLYAKLTLNGKTVYKPLVFNGKREQKIDFELDASATSYKSLFEELDEILTIYRETVIRTSTSLYGNRNAIEAFLADVDTFPLVVGRENRTDKEVKSYFAAYSLYYGILDWLGLDVTVYKAEIYAQGLFAITYQEYASNLDELITLESEKVQTAIFDGVAKALISSDITAEQILELWKQAQKSPNVVEKMEDQFSAYHVFALFVTGYLPLESAWGTAHVTFSGLKEEEKARINFLMDAYYVAGSDYRRMLANLEETDASPWSGFDIKKLTLLIDLCDFGEWYGDFVVAAFSHTFSENPKIVELKDFLKVEESFWESIINATAYRFKQYYPKDSLNLPHTFPGATGEEQQNLYRKKLMDLIVSWFPQYELYNKLSSCLGEGWSNLFGILTSSQWEGFSLTNCDSKKYEEEHPDATPIDGEDLEKLHKLQRLFRLTSDAVAVAYLINNEFDSAFKIAQVDEDLFVAEHALGIGTKEKATQIHRVAKSFMSEATLAFGQYHKSLNESGDTLRAVNRGVTPQLRTLVAQKGLRDVTPTNIAAPRVPMAISPTWKNLFGNINRNGATEGQSVLSASAYFVDILNFFKANKRPYERFDRRRHDLLNLNLTKANAEVAMPTIDLINELLECLVGGDASKKVSIVANQTPADATVASMRAEPLEWDSVEGKTLQEKANKKLMSYAYPCILPINSYRTKATKLLGNIPLTLYNVAENLACDTNNRCCLFVDELLHRILFKKNKAARWESWGLRQAGNNVYLPDKSVYKPDNTPYLKNKGWMEILNCVPILLDRTGLTFKELKEILALPVFASYGVEIHCPDALQYQLADINGYILTHTSAEFFDELAAFIRFHRLLGWSYADISLRYNELNTIPSSAPENYDPLEAWDRVQEMVLRFGVTPLNSLAWNGFALTEDELKNVYDVPTLFERYSDISSESYDDEYIKKDVITAATKCLLLKQTDVNLLVEKCDWNNGNQHEKFLSALRYIYRYGTFAAKHRLTVDELYLFLDARLGNMDDVRSFSAAIRRWQGVSLPISVLEDLLRTPDESINEKAESFIGEDGVFYATINESWNEVKVDDEHDIEKTPNQSIQEEESVEYIIAYKEACSRLVLSLDYADAPFLEFLSQEGVIESESTVYTTLRNWLDGIFGNESPLSTEILGESTPLLRLRSLYSHVKEIWYEKQIYTMLSQEFSIGLEEASQESFKDLLGEIRGTLQDSTSAYDDWYYYATVKQTSPSEIKAYLALYKANLLYQQVCDYVINNPNYGLGLGFGWSNWNLFEENLVLKSSMLEPLVHAFAVSDACGNKEYSYASIPSETEGDAPTPISTLKQLKQLLLIPRDVFKACFSYAFGIQLPDDVDSWPDCQWNKHSEWFRFFKVYQLYLKTFTKPQELEKLFIELDLADLEDVSGKFNNLAGAVKALNDNLKANYRQSDWFKFVQGVSDEIRKERRDALVGFACWESQNEEIAAHYKYPQSFLNANDLYAYYLIDVLMEPDMSMSRIVQANACLQLFVQRCQLGLEGENQFDDAALSQWEWMKNYQVWVANRKVFLYPENWIDVSLREDKTPFFEELEEQLQESDGNSEEIERAYLDYLEKMHDTSNLEIVGVCKEDGDINGETIYTLHIIGRTRGEPHRYYYRKYLAKTDPPGVWLPWESIDVDIQGDVVFPQIMSGRLYLLWPQYMMGQRQVNSGSTSSGEGVRVPEVDYYTEIKVAWCYFNGKKWTGVKTTKSALSDASSDPLDFQLEDGEKINDRYHFKAVIEGSYISLQVYRTLLDIDNSWKALKKVLEELKKSLNRDQKITHKIVGDLKITINTHKNDVKISQIESMISRISREKKKEIKIDSSGKTIEQVVETRLYKGVSTQKISPVGEFRLYADSKDEAYIPDTGNIPLHKMTASSQRGTLVKEFSPDNTYMKHNFWVSNGAQPLKYKGLDILAKENEFSILPVNMDFYDIEDEKGHVCDLPFFYMDRRSTYFVYPKAGIGNQREYEFVLLSHPIADVFFDQYRNGGKKELHTRGIQALEKAESYYTMYSGYNYYFSSAIGYYLAGDWAAWDMGQSFFESDYEPSASVSRPYPAPYVNFLWNTPTGIYNWELFFYVPVRIADKLIAEEKYEAALQWLELVFDPRGKKQGVEKYSRWAKTLPAGAPFWRFLPFFANRDADKTILESLSVLTEQSDLPQKKAMKVLIDQWKNNPFEPHLIAKQRLVAYQKFVVMKYLSTLIARGDELFTQDTTETVNLAIQFYILAADILGPKSAEAPDPFVDVVLTAAQMLNEGDTAWANTLIEYEDSMLLGRERDKDTYQHKLPDRTTMITKISEESYYFNVPRNDTLMAFWDTVADRLYKIRNSLNIEGVKRTLALFAPPIDPGMLVKARAAGLSISDVLADSGAALPHYRFKVIVAKALEIARDLRNMQETLLQALKDKDAEALAQLRVQHRLVARTLSQSIFEIEMKELDAEAASLELEKQKKTKKQEFHKSNSEKLKTDFENGFSKTMKKVAELREKTEQAKRIASALYKIPDLDAGGIVNAFGGVDFHMAAYGGRKLGEAAITMAESYLSKALEKEASAQQQKAQGEGKKEAAEQVFEESVATTEIDQVEKQILINTIRKEHNEKQQELLEKELERIEEEYDFLCDKYTSKDLHEWLVKQLTKLSKTMCKLVTKVAKMAEKCYHFEIGDTDMGKGKTFIGNNYWDGAYSGLLSADRLIADLHAMEVAYLENDKNELEITRPVSFDSYLFEDGVTLMQEINRRGNIENFEFEISLLTEFANQYFRRIRDVRLQVYLKNPNAPKFLNAELTLIKNTMVIKNSGEVQNRIGIQTMATSTAQQDVDKFVFNFSKEKFSPFEGAGADKMRWCLTIPGINENDIDDIILYISYTAKKG